MLVRALLGDPVMKIAIPYWAGRVSPVFDVAKHLLVAEIDNDAEVKRESVAIEETGPGGCG